MEEKRTREQKERMERVERPNAVRAAAMNTRLDALKAESTVLRNQIAEIDKQVRVLMVRFVRVRCVRCVCCMLRSLLKIGAVAENTSNQAGVTSPALPRALPPNHPNRPIPTAS